MNWQLKRRGFDLGHVEHSVEIENLNSQDLSRLWLAGKPALLKGICLGGLERYQGCIEHSAKLFQSVIENADPYQLVDQPPYSEKLEGAFELMGSSVNEGDDQEIETVLFDAIRQGKTVAQDLWMKVSWLSFYDEDASLRFRFSFGVDHVEDVASDKHRQSYAAQLSDVIFPESLLITHNEKLACALKQILSSEEIDFVERIVYFNSQQGGAYLHHDRERGHDGVVYAQLSGQTYWLALPKSALLAEIVAFIENCQQHNHWPNQMRLEQRNELIGLANNPKRLSSELETFANDNLIHLINETEAFVQQLIAAGHGRLIETGDALLLPQKDEGNCCWHSVFNLGQESGQALSFAVRSN